MSLQDKNILITPNRGQSSDPVIAFSGANVSVGPQTVNLRVYPTYNGTLSFEGTAGQLFSITNDLTGSIFSVNDVSGIPSIDVNANGNIALAPFGGNIGIGTYDTRQAVFRVYANNSTDAVRIRQDGTGNGLVISDTSMDLTPFVVDFNGNVGIGTYPPRQTLDVWGNARVTASVWAGNLSVTNTTAATSTATGALTVAGGAGIAGSIFAGGTLQGANLNVTGANLPANGLYLPTTNTLGFATNSTESMRITSAGYVGIGTNIPSTYLHVRGTWQTGQGLLKLDGNSGGVYAGLTYGIDGTTKGYMYWETSTPSLFIGGASTDIIRFGYNATSEWARFDSSGNLAVGTTASSNARFTVQHSSAHVNGFRTAHLTNGTAWLTHLPSSNSGGFNPITQTGDQLLVYSGGTVGTGNLAIVPWSNTTSGIRLDQYGNVSIGTATVGYATGNRTSLTVNGISQSMMALFIGGAQRGYFFHDGTNASLTTETGSLVINTVSSSPMLFYTANTERMRLDTQGNLGIGVSPTVRLDVGGVIRTGVGSSDPGTGAVMYLVGSGAFQTVIGGAALAINTGANNARTEKLRVDSNGNVGINITSPISTFHVVGNATVSNSAWIGNLSVTNATQSTSTSTGALTVAGGVGIGGNLYVAGNLIVNGNVSYLNTNVVVIEDPSIVIGTGPNGTPLITTDSYDRGLEYHYYSGGGDRYGFIGWQNSSGQFVYINNATAGSSTGIYSGPLGDAAFGNIVIGSASNTPKPSTSTSTGALILQGSGGIGVGGNIWVGGTIFGVANSAINANNLVVSATSTNATFYPVFVEATSGNIGIRANSNLSFNPSTASVGIGTTTAAVLLDVVRNADDSTISIRSYNTSQTASAGARIQLATANVAVTAIHQINNNANNPFYQFLTGSGVTAGTYYDSQFHIFRSNAGTEWGRFTTDGFYVGTTGGDYGRVWRGVYRKDQNAVTQVGIINVNSGASAIARLTMITGTSNSYFDWDLADNSASPYSQLAFGSAVTSYRFTYGGVTRFYQDSSGNLSINTTTVGYAAGGRTSVTINGTSQSLISLLDGGTARSYWFNSGGTTYFTSDTNGGALILQVVSANPMQFFTNNTEKMRIDQYGNVSIGTTSVISPVGNRTSLSINGTNQAIAGLGVGGVFGTYWYHDGLNSYFNGSVGSLSIRTDTANPIILGIANVEKARIDSTGNVGIGIATPLYPLHVVGNVFTASSMWAGNLSVTNSTASTSTTTGALTVAGGAGIAGSMFAGGTVQGANLNVTGSSRPANGLYLPTTNTLGFVTNSTEKMRITSTGGVSIGITANQNMLDVVGSVAIGNYAGNVATSANTVIISGQVGIGTSNPGLRGTNVNLVLGKPNSDSGNWLVMNREGTSNVGIGATSGYMNFIADNVSSGFAWITNASGYSLSGGYFSMYMRGGKLLVGGGGPSSAQSNVDVYGNMVIGRIYSGNSATTGPADGLAVQGSVGIGTTVLSAAAKLQVEGNLYVINSSAWFGNISVVNTTPSTSTTTGALRIAGGAGITGNIFAGSDVLVAGKVGIGTNLAASTLYVAGKQIISNVLTSNTMVYTGKSLDISAQDAAPYNIYFRPDGALLYMIGRGSDRVNVYSLTTPWDISTATYWYQSPAVTTQQTDPTGLFFDPTGTKLWISGYTLVNNIVGVYEYNLSIPWNVAANSFSYTQSNLNVYSHNTVPIQIAWKPDGTSLYVLGQGTGTYPDSVIEFKPVTPWTIAGMSNTVVSSFSVAAQETAPSGLSFTSDGTTMLVTGQTGDDVTVYDLAVPWDITSSKYRTQFSLVNQVSNITNPSGSYFKPDGTAFYVTNDIGSGTGNCVIYQFDLGSYSRFDLVGNSTIAGDVQILQNLSVSGQHQGWQANFRGNVGIGTTVTPSIALYVSGNVHTTGYIDTDSQFLGQPTDTAAIPSFTWTGNTNTGMFRPTTSTIAFSTAGTERFRIDANGNVGIGTTSAAYLLTMVQNGNAQAWISATNAGSNSAGISLENQGQRNWQIWADRTNDQLRIGNNARAAVNMAITSSGQVGIGTTGPTTALDVLGTIKAYTGGNQVQLTTDGAIEITRPGGGAYIDMKALSTTDWDVRLQADVNGNLAISTGATAERVRIDQYGNVSIGTTIIGNAAASRTSLTLNGTSTTIISFYTAGASRGYLYHAGASLTLLNSAAGALAITHSAAQPITFATNNLERARIDSAGNVGIGTTSTTASFTLAGLAGGQTTSALNTAGNLYGAMIIGDLGTASGNGGKIVFSAAGPAWRFASIQGLAVNGGGNSTGDITFSTRRATGDAALTESMRITAAGNVGIVDSNPAYPLAVTGTASISGAIRIGQAIVETYASPAISAGTLTIDLNTGTVFSITVDQNITTFSVTNAAASKAQAFTLFLTANGTGYTQNWSGANVKWDNQIAPTLTTTNGRTDILTFVTPNGGTTWYGFVGGQNF